MTSTPDLPGFYGFIEVRRGLKRDSRKRKLPITAAMREVLGISLKQAKGKHVLTCPESPTKAMSPSTLEDQIRRARISVGLPNDAGLHALRHTFLTRAGKLTQNVKALQLLAGHSNIATTMKYIHPEESDIFGIVAAMSSPTLPKVQFRQSSSSGKAMVAKAIS